MKISIDEDEWRLQYKERMIAEGTTEEVAQVHSENVRLGLDYQLTDDPEEAAESDMEEWH